MRLSLRLHPDSVCEAVTSIEVGVARPSRDGLLFRYRVTGAIDDLILPRPATSMRADGLWEHSCFEAFVRSEAEEGYVELNLAPSGAWNAYRLSTYREGMTPLDIKPARIMTRSAGGRYDLIASVRLGRSAEATLRLALSAVIEERSGRKSYWALAHPPGKADFHHPDSFVHELS